MVSDAVRKYLKEIGSKGGKKSRRTLTPEQAKKMVQAREKKRKREKRK
jgi:Spy/CpxP family protein refolding chaperone